MSTLQTFKNSSIAQAFEKAIFIVHAKIVDFSFDIVNGVDTRTFAELSDLSITDETSKKRGIRYQPTRLVPLRKLFCAIKPIIPSDSVLVDLGCGKGRVLLAASELGLKKVIGVEFARELCEIAVKNCAKFKTKNKFDSEYKIVCDDVSNYAINSDENIFFMFNPFDEVILAKVLNNIAASIQENYRRVFVIYHNPVHSNTIEQQKEFSKLLDFNLWHHKFIVYSN
ncbi:MAG TPA: methyltransferase domain-containing protein [Methylotenera sp.]|nr:methyltransferase domain-containing protein [Methylotenera sp.]